MKDPDVTDLLGLLSHGDADAANKLAPLVYAELRTMAGRLFRRQQPGHTLQPTILVHDAFLKMTGGKGATFDSRAHFFAVAAHAMRQILTDHARRTHAAKRGGGEQKLELDESLVDSQDASVGFEALDDALQRLARLNQRQAQVVEMRFFAGMSVKETAKALHLSPSTIKNDWDIARAWLKRELEQ